MDAVIARFLVGLIGLWIVLSLISLYKGLRKKRLPYVFKNTINGTKWGLSLVWSAYFMMGALIPLESINKWVEQRQSSIASVLGQAAIALLPIVYLVTIVCVVCLVMSNADKPFIQYNEKEKEWRKEDGDKLKSWLPEWIFKLVKC